ncbi:MAG: DNA-3-methyladenine glycosylase 2 family protein [Betaproteobacteria bacterium]
MKAPAYWAQATQELASRDPVIASIAAGSAGLTLRSRGDAFATLARSIVGQQISVKAAESVWQKFAAALPVVNPASVAAHPVEALRACGLSGSKVVYLQDLAVHFEKGTLNPARWPDLSDDELIEQLTRVRGIGRWTAEMFLIFYMMRPDILPLADLGVQKAMRLHYNHGRPLGVRKLAALNKLWQPWRSVATWYLWRSLDPIPVEY